MSFRSQEPLRNDFGIPGKSIKLTDPETMRALAHPARIALWQHLMLEGPATATECAPVAELSPSACSYHLRQLARYGFVEQDQAAAANGRERPWRVVITSTTVEDLDDPVAVMAARLLDYSLEERWQVARQRYENSKQDYPAPWRSAAGGDRSVSVRDTGRDRRTARADPRALPAADPAVGPGAPGRRPAGAGRDRLRAAVRSGGCGRDRQRQATDEPAVSGRAAGDGRSATDGAGQ